MFFINISCLQRPQISESDIQYECLTTSLYPDNLTILDFHNPETGRDYRFEPDVEILQSGPGRGRVTNIKPVGSTVVRNRPAWKWSARINNVYSYVYYSIPNDGEISGKFYSSQLLLH